MHKKFKELIKTTVSVMTVVAICPLSGQAAVLNNEAKPLNFVKSTVFDYDTKLDLGIDWEGFGNETINPLLITTAATTSPATIYELPDDTDEPDDATPVEPDTTTDSDKKTLPNMVDNPTYDTPLYLHNDFALLRYDLEDLFNTKIIGDHKEGELYLVYGATAAETSHEDNAIYTKVVQNPKFAAKLIQPEIQSRLKNIADNSFSDVDSSAWYASYIPLAVYYNIANGTGGEGSTFQPAKPINRAEFAVMLASGFYNGQQISANDKNTNSQIWKDLESIDPNAYYRAAWTTVSDSMTDMTGLHANTTFTKGNMTRAEAAYAIAMNVTGDFASYQPSNNPFTDLTERTDDINDPNTAFQDMLANPQNGVFEDYYNAILYLNEKGIMSGDAGSTTVRPLDTISKAEVLVLIQKASIYNGTQIK